MKSELSPEFLIGCINGIEGLLNLTSAGSIHFTLRSNMQDVICVAPLDSGFPLRRRFKAY